MHKEFTHRGLIQVGFAIWLAMLASCSEQSSNQQDDARSASNSAKSSDLSTDDNREQALDGLQMPADIKATLSITIRWSAQIVTGIPAEGLTTDVYKRTASLECPITSGDVTTYSYFAAFDNPNGDPMAATGSYQPWWNEECTGSLTIDDTHHADDPTLEGPEPIVSTTGTRPLSTGDTPLTVETDLNRARTRYLFISPSANGFQQHAIADYPALTVAASAAPIATLDFTLQGPIGDGKQEIVVPGGSVWVDWTFKQERKK